MFEHVSEVAVLVEEQGGTEVMIAATWLHDVVEDTDVTLEQVGEWFGSEVRALVVVDGLTDPDVTIQLRAVAIAPTNTSQARPAEAPRWARS